MNYKLSKHAIEEMHIREISESIVREIVENPQQTFEQDGTLEIRQSIVNFGQEGSYLVRVFINAAKNPNLVVTIYRTSKIKKYWQ